MSDIGCYLECPRATLAGKLFTRTDQSLEELLPLQRGHRFEAGIVPGILSQHPATFQQLEIEVEYEGVPIRAHLDPAFEVTGRPEGEKTKLALPEGSE